MRNSCRTHDKRLKTRRANWDISILSENQSGTHEGKLRWFDCLKLNSAVEFGLNPTEVDHLEDDIERLSHPESGVEHGFVVHLYRLSKGVTRKDWGAKWSRRIWSSDRLKTFVSEIDMNKLIEKNKGKVIGYWALYDDIIGKRKGPYRIDGKSEPYLLPGGWP